MSIEEVESRINDALRADHIKRAKKAIDERKKALSFFGTIESENVVFFDVDDTLVMWSETYTGEQSGFVKITDPYDGKDVYLKPHAPHIKLLKNQAARGAYVVVWSAGGYQWASAVVKALGLSEQVKLVMSKPRAFVDDLPATEILGEHIYMQPDSKWGQNETVD